MYYKQRVIIVAISPYAMYETAQPIESKAKEENQRLAKANGGSKLDSALKTD